MMIGKWNKSVILTYIGVLCGLYGMFIANTKINYAIIALIVAGICDMLDGTIARMCKRTDEEKRFGIQLDSLADAINFGVLPIVIIISLMGISWINFIGCGIYVIFGIARLAYFNILAEENSDEPMKFYHGLPITSIAITMPLSYVISMILIPKYAWLITYAALLFTGIFFVVDIHVKKLSIREYVFCILLAIITIFVLVVKI